MQDRVLSVITSLETGFYLTGGTAASRAYLSHRFSEDLDLFVNDDQNFALWADRIVQAVSTEWNTEVLLREPRFVRANLRHEDFDLKLELINDVPSHVGPITIHPTLGAVDSARNILANKVSAAIDRKEPKDLADIWGFCVKMGLSLEEAITGAQSKAAGIFPADLARVLSSVSSQDWELIRWIDPPTFDEFCKDLKKLAEMLLIP